MKTAVKLLVLLPAVLLPTGKVFALSWDVATVDSAGNVGRATSIAIDSNDHVHISYVDDTDEALGYAFYDGSWHTYAVASAASGVGSTSIALGSDDNPRISYVEPTPIHTIVKYAYYDGTWNTSTVVDLDTAQACTGLALDSGDRPHICYTDYTDGSLNYAYRDGTWQTAVVDTGAIEGVCSIAVDSQGHIHIGYAKTTATGQSLNHAYYDGSWHLTTVDDSGIVGRGLSLALGSSDNPHLSYYDSTNADLKYAYFDGSWHTRTVDSAGQVGDYSSIALDKWNQPHISYYDHTHGALKYAHRDATGWYMETVEGGNVGKDTSIALDSMGHPWISFHGWATRDLLCAHRLVPTLELSLNGRVYHEGDRLVLSAEAANPGGSVPDGGFLLFLYVHPGHLSFVTGYPVPMDLDWEFNGEVWVIDALPMLWPRLYVYIGVLGSASEGIFDVSSAWWVFSGP